MCNNMESKFEYATGSSKVGTHTYSWEPVMYVTSVELLDRLESIF